MRNFYFTFGLGHKNRDRYQIIVAPDEITAQKRMFELHGKDWALPYTEEEWDEACFAGFTRNLKRLQIEVAE